MGSSASDELIRTWVTGWASARGYESRHEGRVHAALRHDTIGDWEYVIHQPSADELTALSETLHKHPARRLTVFVEDAPGFLANTGSLALAAVTTNEVLMVTDMVEQDVELPRPMDGFVLQTETDGHRAYVSVHVEDNEDIVAASGHVSSVDGFAVFDRIITAPEFRRRGLGSFVMRALASLAQEHDVEEGLLVASADGQALYGYLGWTPLGSMLTLEATQR